MSCLAPEVFEGAGREDHSNDPALAVDGLSDLWPSQTTLDMDSALAVGNLAELFPGRDADAIDYFSIAHDHDAPASDGELPADTPVDDDDLAVDDAICQSEQVFESGHIFQSDIQRAAMEFQRFAEKFHAFAAECQERVTV